MSGTTMEGQKDDEQVKLLCAAFFALTEEAKKNIDQIRSVFLEEIFATVKFQLEKTRILEENFDEAAKRWEAEKKEIEQERERSALFMVELLEEHKKALASHQSALSNHQMQQDEVLSQLAAEKEQLLCQYENLLTRHVDISKSLQKLENEKQELQALVHKYDEEIKKGLQTMPEGNRFARSISKLLVEKVNLKCPFQKHFGYGANADGHAEPEDSTQPAGRAGQSALRSTTEQEQFQYRRKYHSMCRAYNRLLRQLAERSSSYPDLRPLQDLVPNIAHAMSAKELRTAGKTDAISKTREVITRKKGRERQWRNTRARATASERDPHDDFLDTPRDMALVTVNENDVMIQANTVVWQGEKLSSDNSPKHSPTLGKQISAGCDKPPLTVDLASLRQENVVPAQDTTHYRARSILTSEDHQLNSTEESRGIANYRPVSGTLMAQTRYPPADLQNAFDRPTEHSHLEPRPSTIVADGSTTRGKKSFSLAGAPFKYVEPVRKKRDREALAGTECKQCKQFYDAVLAADPDGLIRNRCEHRDAVSRHRYRFAPPQTPDGFWNIGFDSDL